MNRHFAQMPILTPVVTSDMITDLNPKPFLRPRGKSHTGMHSVRQICL